MASFVAEFRKRIIVVQGNLAVFHYLELHPGASLDRLPAKVDWHNNGGPFSESVWTTAQQGAVLGLMPPEEVRDQNRLYRLLQTCSDSFASYRIADTEARAYLLIQLLRMFWGYGRVVSTILPGQTSKSLHGET
jgi:hypothetical protein